MPVMFDKEIFFQIEAEVVKNLKRTEYVNGMVNEDEVKYQLAYEGGAGVCLHFPGCDQRPAGPLHHARGNIRIDHWN